ncbi:uncharacterized protein EKO05_0009363 [Ascochyta rabiei]|uniref:uncharacterized protein n=1 Tax=Didymella rabiei TaxID=5454 RepID=UPI00220B0B54|nr:uncharacterized protein EKO05_0009363 [Ascochyta rabiei]UPX19089.1 hypothetical protein EKO05_0009363 [Ascochyta rabiei]
MAHKRKSTGKDEGRLSKKARAPTSTSASTRSKTEAEAPVVKQTRGNPVHTATVHTLDDGTEPSHVEWALPTKADNKTIDDSAAITQFVPLFSNRHWSRTRTLRVPFHASPLRSPLYKKRGSPDMEAGSDPNKSSHCLVQLFNRIKRRTESPNDDTVPGTYQRAAFERAFGTGDEQFAVVASTSSTDAIFTVTHDYQVDVTLRHSPHRQDHARINFIRRLPPGAEHDRSTPYAYFIVVPPQTKLTINGQTYINDAPHDRKTAAKADAVELSGRDENGDVDEGIVDIAWSSSERRPPRSATGLLDLDDQAEHPSDDEWTDDSGEAIEDNCGYLKRRLWAPQRMCLDELIPRVLTSINLRQAPSLGFSFTYTGRKFRPGRTLITAVPHQNYHVILIVLQNDVAKPELRILDPMAWRSKRAERATLVTHANELILRQDSRPGVASEKEGQEGDAPLSVTWAPCAQGANEEDASTFTILNAWAIAMGLRVDSAFTPDQHGGENFFTRAQWLFDIARRDSLDWKLLLAFFKCTRFIEAKEPAGDEVDHVLPPLDRRFRQSRRSFERAIKEQKEADDAELAGPNADTTSCLAVETGTGIAHSALFPADETPDKLLSDPPPFANPAHWQLAEIAARLVEQSNRFNRAAQSTNPPAAPTPSAPKNGATPFKANASGPTKPLAGTAPTARGSIESQELDEDFNACDFFHKEITARKAQVHIEDQSSVDLSQGPALSSKDVFDSIDTVARALNRLQRAEEGTAVVGQSLQRRGAVRSDSDPKLLTDGVLLLPWQYEQHTLLVVAQSASKSPGGNVLTCHVVDSAPWTLKQDKRQQVRDAVVSVLEEHWRPEHAADGANLAPGMTWVWGPRQRDLWQCRYHAIFNAWSVMLDCTLNTNFTPRGDFFQRGREVIAVVLAGCADWKLIYSFLLCYGYVKQGELPGEERRFASTVDGRDFKVDLTLRKAAPYGYDFSKRVDARLQRPYDVVFKNWNGWDETDVSVRLPALFKADKSPLNLDTTQLRDAYHELVTQPRQSTADFTNTDRPCVYVKERLAALLSDEDTRQRLGSLRSQSSVTTKAGSWLLNEEVALAIASVTLAITSIQDVTKGFCAVSGTDVQVCYQTTQEHRQDIGIKPVPRFGRPMFVPIVEGSHTVLGVVQLDRNDNMTVSILDSKVAHYSRATRTRVFNMVMATAEGMSWWQGKFASWKDVLRPSTATWITCAQQPSDDECGYLAILNSWALALGLELNPQAAPIWDSKATGTDNLFQTVLDIVHLARLGLVDWTLIYAFLRCHRFVHEGTVPRDRRFTNTVRLQDENELNERLQGFSEQDTEHWLLESSALNDIRRSNAIPFPEGLEHTSFPEDEWATTARPANLQKALALSALGHVHIWMSSAEFLRFYQYFCGGTIAQTKNMGLRIGADKATFFLNSLRWQRKAIKGTTREHLLGVYRDFLSNARSQKSSLARLQERHCAVTGEGLGLLQTLFANAELDRILASGIPNIRRERYLDLGEVNLAIAAVVEAIDARQASLHHATCTAPFTGGFALATRNHMQIARNDASADGAVSRPRRCFLLPMTINDTDIQREQLTLLGNTNASDIDWSQGNKSHHFLAVVQEESRTATLNNPATRQFCIYTLDSAPRRFREDVVQQLFHKTIRDTATNLGWTRQRNEDGAVRFRQQHSQVGVFPQLGGGWQCGLHTILNAWILALGLMPRSEHLVPGADFYNEFWVLVRAAVAGLLDWKTLVAWLFCNNLVTSRSLASVPDDRRFETTRYQDCSSSTDEYGEYEFFGEVGLVGRVENMFMQDLAAVLETEAPYDHSSNVDFSGANIVGAAAGDGTDSKSESGSEDQDSEADSDDESSEPSNSSTSSTSSTSSDPSTSPSSIQPTNPKPEDKDKDKDKDEDEDGDKAKDENESDTLTDRDAEGCTDDGDDDKTNENDELKSLKRTFDDLDVDVDVDVDVDADVDIELNRPQKRVSWGRGYSHLNFLADVDGDCGGDVDVKMMRPPWQRIAGLAFLAAL